MQDQDSLVCAWDAYIVHYAETERWKKPKFENTRRVSKAIGEGVVVIVARKATPSWSLRRDWPRSRIMPAKDTQAIFL